MGIFQTFTSKNFTFLFSAISATVGSIALFYNIKMQRKNRINAIVERYIHNLSDTMNRVDGIVGLVRAGICDISSKNEFWEIIEKISMRTEGAFNKALTTQIINHLKELKHPA